MSYTRRAFERLADPAAPITLKDIPPDAPYRGDGPLWAWSEESKAWVSFADLVFERAHRDRAERAQKEHHAYELQNLQLSDPA